MLIILHIYCLSLLEFFPVLRKNTFLSMIDLKNKSINIHGIDNAYAEATKWRSQRYDVKSSKVQCMEDVVLRLNKVETILWS